MPAFTTSTIFDREDDVGGTWRRSIPIRGWQCDVKSTSLFVIHSTYGPALGHGCGPDCSPRSAALLRALRPRVWTAAAHLKLRAEIRSASWDEEMLRRCLTAAIGEQHHFNVVVSAVGLFTRPLLPDLVVSEPFAGTVMHSSRWDHSVSLEGARVAGIAGDRIATAIATGAGIGQGRQPGVCRCNWSPTWILPKPDRHYTHSQERWVFAVTCRSPKSCTGPRLWLLQRIQLYSVIEHASEKTQEFTASALKMLEKSVMPMRNCAASSTPAHPMEATSGWCSRRVFVRIDPDPTSRW